MGIPPHRSPGRANLPIELLHRGYKVLNVVGRGSSSEVYEARHGETGRLVAIKVALANIPHADRVSARLQTAWNVGRGLRHPHLVATLDGGRLSDGRAWIAMERLRGLDLQYELDEKGALPPARAVHIMRQVCEALLVLHRRGAIHRDVKPENIFRCETGRYADHVKLIDLGVLALEEADPHRAHEITGPVIMGTPLYLAPELARGQKPGACSDLYSVGAVLYHLLTGAPPYDGDDPTAVVERHLNEPVPRLDPDGALDLPLELCALTRQCMAKMPAARPADAAVVIAVLDRCQMALAGGMPSELLSHEAVVPGVPVVGAPAEWTQFSEDLRANIELCWPRPRAEIRQALEWARDARDALSAADARASEHRARADRAARHRIEARNRLEARLDLLESALEAERGGRNEAAVRVDEAAKARDDLDEQYREAVSSLQALGGGELDSVNPTDVLPVVARVRELLALRNELEQTLRSARDGERDASEQVALTLAEEVEVRRVLADVELEEQDAGERAELLAASTTDEVITAQRAFENACLNLYLQYVKRAHASAGGVVDVSINVDAASLATSDFDPDA